MKSNQTCTDIYISGRCKRTGSILVTLIPIFKITRGHRIVKNDFSALYLLRRLIDFNQTCTDILLGDAKQLISDLEPIFKKVEG